MTTPAPLLHEPLPVELMNTVWADRDGRHDALSSSEQTSTWLTAIAPRSDLVGDGRLAGTTADADLSQRLRVLRDALRRLAAEATQDPRATATSGSDDRAAAIVAVNAAASASTRWTALHWVGDAAPTRSSHASAPLPEALLAEIANEGIALLAGADRDRLRACLAPGCVLYFVKTHSRREWCSAGCGNRARVARHYQRHHPPKD